MTEDIMKKVELTEQEKDLILEDLYKSFKTGYDFEDFLKPLLEKMGLDEVRVTKRSGDGGIDLEGIRYGVIDNNDDSVKYIVQAKRYKPSTKISPDFISQLRGNMPSGSKGIFISTCGFTKKAEEKATDFQDDRPIVLIDGKALVDICIEKNIGIVYKPVFSASEVEKFYRKNNVIEQKNNKFEKSYIIDGIEKDITANDIRARIISIPRTIMDVLPADRNEFNLCFNGNKLNNIRISSDRRFFSRGITDMYRRYGLLTADNVYIPSRSIWKYDGETIFIDLLSQDSAI